MLKTLRIRVDSTSVYLTGSNADGYNVDLAQLPRATGADQEFDIRDLVKQYGEHVMAQAKAADDAAPNTEPASEPDVYQADVNASKNARSMAKQYDVDLSKVDGSGKDGKVIVTDVEDYIESRDVEASGVPADGESE